MRILFLHPEDSPRRGPWVGQRWDLVVDLGKSSLFSESAWSELFRCRVLRTDSLRQGIEDVKMVRKLFAAGRGRLLDEEGIDWWDLTSLVVAPQAETVLVLRRLAAEIDSSAELWATRPGWPANALALLLKSPVQSFSGNSGSKLIGRVKHYGGLLRRFSLGQIKQIFLDKYDSGYEWRGRFAPTKRALPQPVVLLPSAYGNVSRMAASYARILPRQSFLLVATRQSAKEFEPPPNVQVRDLASYANTSPPRAEIASLLERWTTLEKELRAIPEFDVLSQAAVFHPFPGWFRDCLRARNAWREVLVREPVCGVLCGDDSNIYTRVPVLLAAKRKIPTVDFHHGALDGRYLLKDLPCDVYLAKNEMERDYLLRVCGLPAAQVPIGGPLPVHGVAAEVGGHRERDAIIYFSEPYEVPALRTEEVYREILPRLCRVARENGRRVIVKLHPFESLPDRTRLVQAILPQEDHSVVSVVDGPLSQELLSQAWFGITVESTTAIDCLLQGIRCFMCGWLAPSSCGYSEQYVRFGIGELLRDAESISEIPQRLAQLSGKLEAASLTKSVEPEALLKWLTIGYVPASGARQVS
jgi:hypothetical protein